VLRAALKQRQVYDLRCAASLRLADSLRNFPFRSMTGILKVGDLKNSFEPIGKSKTCRASEVIDLSLLERRSQHLISDF
jgi:hypothetical protein